MGDLPAFPGLGGAPHGRREYAPDALREGIVRIVLIVVLRGDLLYLVYLLRKPISWLLVARFLAVALSGPVNCCLETHAARLRDRGRLSGPPGDPVRPDRADRAAADRGGHHFADNVPPYATTSPTSSTRTSSSGKLDDLRRHDQKLEDEAGKLPERLGGAAATLRDVGFGIVNSLFALISILVLTAFLLGSGRNWMAARVGSIA